MDNWCEQNCWTSAHTRRRRRRRTYFNSTLNFHCTERWHLPHQTSHWCDVHSKMTGGVRRDGHLVLKWNRRQSNIDLYLHRDIGQRRSRRRRRRRSKTKINPKSSRSSVSIHVQQLARYCPTREGQLHSLDHRINCTSLGFDHVRHRARPESRWIQPDLPLLHVPDWHPDGRSPCSSTNEHIDHIVGTNNKSKRVGAVKTTTHRFSSSTYE